MEFSEKVAIVSGGSSGLGAATARLLARQGAQVVLLARHEEALRATAAAIEAEGGRVAWRAVDLSQGQATAPVAAGLLSACGPPALLVNNAGAGRWLALEETSPEEGVAMMAAPYFAAFNTTRAFLPAMLAQGEPAQIVNVTSLAAYVAVPGSAGYSAARWAMRGFSQALAAELRGTPVGVTLFAAAKIATPYFAHNPGSEERIPAVARLARTLTPPEAAAALLHGAAGRRREVVVPFMARLFVRFHRLWPGVADWLVWRTGWQRPGQGPISRR